MRTLAANVENGVVVNVITAYYVWANESFDGEWVDATGFPVVIGSLWDGETFSIPEGVEVYFEEATG